MQMIKQKSAGLFTEYFGIAHGAWLSTDRTLKTRMKRICTDFFTL